MCGIVALISTGFPVSKPLIAPALDAVRHRGPDGEGAVFFQRDRAEPVVCGGPDTPSHVWQAGLRFTPLPEARHNAVDGAFLALGHRRLSIIDIGPTGHQPMCSVNERYWITYNGEIYNHVELRQELESLGHAFRSRSDTEVMLVAYQQWGKECLRRFNGMFAFVLFDRKNNTLF